MLKYIFHHASSLTFKVDVNLYICLIDNHPYFSFVELSDGTREEWNEIVTNSLAETNQKNLIAPLVSDPHQKTYL